MIPSAMLVNLIFLAGLAQVGLVAGSIYIPKVLGWKDDVAQLKPLTRQVFWVWAGYIWSIHWCFAILSLFGPHWLVDRTPLARAVSAFIAL